MPRSACICFLLLLALCSKGQGDTLAQKFSKTVCDCFGETRKQKGLSEDAFGECIAQVITQNNDQVMRECLRVYGDTSEESAYKLGKALFDKIKIGLVDDCYDFFILMDSLRYSAFTGLNEDSLKKELKWFDSKIKAPDSSTFYTDRGILKLQLKDINGACHDLEKAVRLQEDNVAARLFRGWAMEMKKEYEKAISDFQYVAEVTDDPDYEMMVAIVKRKKRIAQGNTK
ncbi:MAG: hypothetical protein Q8941_15030 [Bacteroidota bacterium]|nr:hypothetical protein [Bacteroidota bacterium]